jgi:hypothetical protein
MMHRILIVAVALAQFPIPEHVAAAPVAQADVAQADVAQADVAQARVAQAQVAQPLPTQPAQAQSESTLSVDALLKKIGGKPVQQTRFVEKKYLAVLDAPVESSGVLRYQAPARLEKNTERPMQESMMIDGDLLVVEREGKRRSMPAAQFPGVAALVGGLRDILGGNAEALRRLFKVVIQGDASRWQMDLLPSDPTSAQLVNRITLRGRDDKLLEVETLQADGDRSVMSLSPE